MNPGCARWQRLSGCCGSPSGTLFEPPGHTRISQHLDELKASQHAREALAEPDERYWPRGFLASTILGALLWRSDREGAQAELASSERINRERLEGGDEGYMPHIDLAAVEAIRGEARAACRSLRAAIAAGWRYPALAGRDRRFESLRTDDEFLSLVVG